MTGWTLWNLISGQPHKTNCIYCWDLSHSGAFGYSCGQPDPLEKGFPGTKMASQRGVKDRLHVVKPHYTAVMCLMAGAPAGHPIWNSIAQQCDWDKSRVYYTAMPSLKGSCHSTCQEPQHYNCSRPQYISAPQLYYGNAVDGTLLQT